MTAPPRITDAQRRARLVRRHLLAPAYRVPAPEQVADALVALHATDPATVFLAVAARSTDPDPARTERALYEDLSLTRMLSMRRTMFVLPAALAPQVRASTARAVAAKERAGCRKLLEQAGWSDAKCAAVEQELLAVLAERGSAAAAELAAAVPELGEQVVLSPDKPYAARVGLGSRILRVLTAEGRIRRDRPRGSWTSAQFRWAPAAPEPSGGDPARARAELARRYLAAYGPAGTEDLKWWTGWTLTDTRKAIAAAGAVPVELDHGAGHVLPEDLGPAPDPGPAAALLPSLDPTAMGWRHRGFYLDPGHTGALFDRNGNIGPTVWWNGRVIGAWAQLGDGRIAHRLLTDPGAEARAAVEAEAARLTAFLGDTRVTPCYRTPLERELAAGGRPRSAG
ncbi:winged helix DNA-binding domain-containing protein [Nocardiopsis composta]|uniref:Winged helix DNA-binding domain-containing protein n=1 Tax=Nocardiopsis composta TaxID=157465 RepID=A0A7W8VCJ5_9ACTN|nr:winged helix DNA-binding domain-containing protein [Nocardiopsis composta]MBB5430959.1 hypothetical protein [Nocardiopsis composta]